MNLKTELYPYQQRAVDKLIGIRVGALYMEMGTGKTRTALEIIKRRLDAGKIGHVLWLCPCSVRENLRQDIIKHADGALAHIAIFGIESLSASVRLFEALSRYVTATQTMLIVDESNLVKNHRAKRTERITELAAACRYRLILNGTPISRNEADLFAQWYLLDWRILGYRSFWSFAANHLEYDPDCPGRIRRVLNTDYLVEKIAPYSFQVSREECFDLPGKSYHTQYCAMTDKQQAHYDHVVDQMLEMLDERRPDTIYRMFSAARAIMSGLWVSGIEKHIRTHPMFPNPMDNPRIQALLEVVELLHGEQAIIFASYTHEIDAILQVLPSSIPFYGEISQKKRQESIEAFRSGRQFLVANKSCAAYGLNLQFCHNVIYFSNDWDWATRTQSEDRVYRIGQDHEVMIYDMCMVDSLDERIMRCLSRKEKLSDLIKHELNESNDVESARGTFRQWLHGNLKEGGNANEKDIQR